MNSQAGIILVDNSVIPTPTPTTQPNLYSAPAAAATPNLYSGLATPDPTVPVPPPPTVDVTRQAQLASLNQPNVQQGGPAVLQAMQDNTAKYKSIIQQYGDNDTRMQIAAQQQMDEVNALTNLSRQSAGSDPDGSIAQGAAIATQGALANDIQARSTYAMEQGAITTIQNLAQSGDTTQANIMASDVENGTPENVISDTNTKKLILQRAIENANVSAEDQGWVGNAASFLLSWVPFYNSTGKVGNMDTTLKNWWDGVFPGDRASNERASLWDLNPVDFKRAIDEHVLPAVQASSKLFGVGWEDKQKEAQILSGFKQSGDPGWVNAGAALDNFGLLPFTKMGKVAMSIPSLLIRNGARAEETGLMAKAFEDTLASGGSATAEASGVSTDDLEASILPDAARPGPGPSTVSTGVDINAKMQQGRALLQQFNTGLASDRFQDPVEFQKAVDFATASYADTFGRELKDVALYPNTLADGTETTKIGMTIGTKAGPGYATQRSLDQAMGGFGYSDYETVRDESGQYFGRLIVDMPETGMYTNTLNPLATNSISVKLLNARRVGDQQLADAAQQAGNIRSSLIKQVTNYATASFKDLRPNEMDALRQVAAQGENAGKWLTDDELGGVYQRAFNRQPSSREISSYHAMINANDMEFAIRNDNQYKQALLQGQKTISLDTGLAKIDRENGQVFHSISNLSDRSYMPDQQLHFAGDNALTAAKAQELTDKGYVQASFQNPVRLADGTTVKSFIVKPKDLDIEELRRDQLAYREGGHRMYSEKYFGKQAAYGVQPDTGQKFLKNPSTYRTFATQAQAEEWAKTMNLAREAAVERAATPAELDQIFKGHPSYPTATEFLQGIKDGTYDSKAAFGSYYDRELPEEYQFAKAGIANYSDPELTGNNGWLQTNGRMYYSSKGDHITDWQGRLAPTLDPFETINTALSNVANLSSFSDYKAQAVERWVNTFQKYLTGVDANASTTTKFAEGEFIKGASSNVEKIRAGAEGQRDIIKRNLGWKTDADIEQQQFARKLGNWITGSDPYSLQHKLTAPSVTWWSDKNPISALRGLVFDSKLGLFNIGQMPLQIGTAMAAVMLSPKNGLKGMISLFPLRAYLTKSGTEEMLGQLASNGAHKLGGFADAEDMKAFMRSAKGSGFFDFGGTHQLVSSYGPNAAIGQLGSKIQQAREAGRFFFNEGEVWNRAVAYRIGWEEAKEKGGMAVNSPQWNRFVAGKAENYAQSMSEQSASAWQHGITSIPTQFWAYNAHMLESMLGGNFTRAQRLRLVIGQTLLLGSTGIPALGLAADAYKYYTQKNGTYPDINTWGGALDRGLLDEIIYHTTGMDVMVGDRIATGGWVDDTIKDIFGWSSFGTQSVAAMAGGATLGTAGQVLGDLGRIAIYATKESGANTGYPLTRDAVLKLAAEMSTVGNGLKAYQVFKYGTYVTNTGTVLASDVPKVDAFGVAVGFQLGKVDQVSAMMDLGKFDSQWVDQAAKVIQNYRTKMTYEPDKVGELGDQINLFVKLLPPSIRVKALQKAHNGTPIDLYTSQARSIAHDKAQAMMIQSVGDTDAQPN